MNTVKELHIGVRQGLQKVASNQSRNFLDEEIDLALNINQERIIKSRVKRTEGNTGFAFDQKSLDDISNLLVFNHTEKVTKLNATAGYIQLPVDYSYLVADKSKIYSNCNKDFTQNTTSVTEHISIVRFPNSLKTTAFYDTFNITIGGNILFSNADYGKVYHSPFEKFYLINLVLEDVNVNKFNNTAGYRIYWEKYKTTYKPDSFIIVSVEPITGILEVDNAVTYTFTSASTSYQVFADKVERTVPNTLTNNAILNSVLADPFAKSNLDFVVSSISGNNLYVFFDHTFIISELIIDYIRKPRQISLSLNRMCELREHLHQEIVENTIQYLMLVTENPTYQVKHQDNKLNSE